MKAQSLKHLFRDLLISIFSLFGIARLYRARVYRNNPQVRIVVFHDVPDAAWFEAMIRTLKESFTVISPEDFYHGTLQGQTINVLVTFDDGYASWIDVALPILNKYKVQGIFFINSGLVDGALDEVAVTNFMKDRLLINPRQAIDWAGVRKLQAAGHTIGGHGETHADLTLLSAGDLTKEIEDDKQLIEKQLGVTLTDFAYPFGTKNHLNDAVCNAAEAASYTRAYTAITGFAKTSLGYRIPRLCIETGTTPRQLKSWVSGAYDLFVSLKSWVT